MCIYYIYINSLLNNYIFIKRGWKTLSKLISHHTLFWRLINPLDDMEYLIVNHSHSDIHLEFWLNCNLTEKQLVFCYYYYYYYYYYPLDFWVGIKCTGLFEKANGTLIFIAPPAHGVSNYSARRIYGSVHELK
jgi:hypothetical protein